jgi:hypothetical protein
VPTAHQLLHDISAAYRQMVRQEEADGPDMTSGPGSAWYKVCRDWQEVRAGHMPRGCRRGCLRKVHCSAVQCSACRPAYMHWLQQGGTSP